MNNTEEQITCTEEQIIKRKRADAIKWLESIRVDSDDEELMDALNKKKMPWACGK